MKPSHGGNSLTRGIGISLWDKTTKVIRKVTWESEWDKMQSLLAAQIFYLLIASLSDYDLVAMT